MYVCGDKIERGRGRLNSIRGREGEGERGGEVVERGGRERGSRGGERERDGSS